MLQESGKVGNAFAKRNDGADMAFPKPPESKKAVDRAGRRIADGCHNDGDIATVDQWRASHGYVLNTFKAMLRQRIKGLDGVEFVQRLKRRNTVVDKLQRRRPDGSRLIGNVTSMHDFAGCRLIFPSIQGIRDFRLEFNAAMSAGAILHKRKNEQDRYDYIAHPKATGYRGIHDVFAHRPRSHVRGDDKNKPWHGLLVEIQYRTAIQNSWATAVEIADLIDDDRTKFEFGDSERGQFFAISSEVIARQHENMSHAYEGRTTGDLIEELLALEARLGILARLRALRSYSGNALLGKHSVLNIVRDKEAQHGFTLDIRSFTSGIGAIAYTNELESDPSSLNAVYVRADNPAQLRSAYKNYFSDPTDFVGLLAK